METAQQYVRLGAYALIAGGASFAIAIFFHGDETAVGFVPDATWMWVHAVIGVAFIAIVFGLVGLSLKIGHRLNQIERLGMFLSIATVALLSGFALWLEGLVIPSLAALNPELLGPMFTGAMETAVMGVLGLFSLAFIVLAAALWRHGFVEPYVAVLYVGGPLLAFAPPIPYLLGIVGGIAWGVGLLLTGIKLMREE